MKHWLHDHVSKHWPKLLVGGHCSYLFTALLEGHGLYSIFAGVLGVMIVSGAIFHLDGGEM